MTCRYCGADRLALVDSYKHEWLECTSCRNIVRRQKPRYLAERALPAPLASWLSTTNLRGVRSLRPFFADRAVLENGEATYDYLANDLDRGVENTKYKGQLEAYLERLARWGIDLQGREVLDISGGPGFFVHGLEGIAKRAVMTEYNETVARVAHEKLGIETAHYDFNVHQLADVTTGAFDFVFVRYALNFCVDLAAFVGSLKERLHPGAHVYLAYIAPTLGSCLRWQFDDYTVLVLYHPETVARVFAEAGFRLVVREDESQMDYRAGADRLRRAILPFFALKNRLLSGADGRLEQDSLVQLYQYDPR